jgi:hypothetical protein
MLAVPRCSHPTGFALQVYVRYWQSLEFLSDTVSTKNVGRVCLVWQVMLRWAVPIVWVSGMAERSYVTVWGSEFAFGFLISVWNGRTKTYLWNTKSSVSLCKDEWSQFNPDFHKDVVNFYYTFQIHPNMFRQVIVIFRGLHVPYKLLQYCL